MNAMRLTRRAALLGLGSAVALGGASLALAAAPTDRRLVVVLLRGGMDGLAVVVPHGERDLATWRAGLVPAGLLDLGGFWGLHPALPGLHRMYQQGDLLAVQAIASPDRSRSHFAAQDTLELGGHGIASGWLNRAAGLVPAHGGGEVALAVGAGTPLLLRGPAPVGSFLPQGAQHPPPDYYAAVLALNRADPVTGPPLARALAERGFTEAVLAGAALPTNRGAFPVLAEAAGRLLAAPDGPRIAALELGGWDTHVNQAPRLAAALAPLDAGLTALRTGLDAAWARTVVLVVTEFGRTVRMNGSRGTDHGTATVALLLGGAVAGGRVAGAWPGLAAARLFEKRDLQPTTDVRALAKGVLAQHLGLDTGALARVFPDSAAARPMAGLLRA
jgi:uncharacterized protein (DUF1501 family)